MLYLDTSLLVAAFADEIDTDRVQAWFGERQHEEFAVSDWLTTELRSTVAKKVRTGELDLGERAAVLDAVAQLSRRAILLEITSFHFAEAGRICDRYDLGLRAGDALHLAIAQSHTATLCTLDVRLAKAGRAWGADTILV